MNLFDGRHYPITTKTNEDFPPNTWGLLTDQSATIVVNGETFTYVWDEMRFSNGRFEFIGLRQVTNSASNKSPSETQ